MNVAEISIPPYHTMLWPTLLALKELGGSATVIEVADKAIELAGYTEDQQAVLLNGTGPNTLIRYRMSWARSYLRLVGAAENSSRGVWSITDYGRSLQESDMGKIPGQVRAMRRKGGPRTKSTAQDGVVPEVGEPESESRDASLVENWRDQLLSVLQSMQPASFERLCQRLLRESNFTRVAVTGRSGDGGIDGIGVLTIGLLSFQVFFQCKRYKGSVGASAIRDFRGAMIGRTDKGLLITTGIFTSEAKKEATRDGAPVLDLIDGDQLCELLKERGLGVTTRRIEEVEIEADWFERL